MTDAEKAFEERYALKPLESVGFFYWKGCWKSQVEPLEEIIKYEEYKNKRLEKRVKELEECLGEDE